jgi:N-acyl-D-amino-acid deacylase
MTGKPAVKFGLKNRGFLREGYAADIVVFRPDAIASRATMEDPYRYPDGIEWVLVNGTIALEQGRLTKRRSGMILRRRGWFYW